MNSPNGPLSGDELAAFVAFLNAEPGRMPYEMCIGFLAAIASLPEVMLPSEWLPEVLGQAPVEDEAEARSVFGASMTLYNHCVAAVEDDAHAICPPPHEQVSVAAFCEGYLRAVDLGHPGLDSEAPEILEALGVLAALADPAKAHAIVRLEKGETLKSTLAFFREGLPATVEYLSRHWREDELRPEPARREPRPERNAPCPCGSGKKYKRCCLQ